jgi:N-acetylglucosamine malate deacetylase 1
MTKLDILVFAAHPDDAELACSGTIAKSISEGKKVGIIDLTKGELGTRGTAQTRKEEAENSTKILGIHIRENLGFADGFFTNDQTHQLAIIQILRKYKPEIVLANAIHDRHPDHARGAELVEQACFLSGLKKIETYEQNTPEHTLQQAWRPKLLFHYIQDQLITPDFVIDISEFWETKKEAIQAFKTQFFSSDSQEPVTYISTPDFMRFIESRAMEYGHSIGTKYGEGFTKTRQLGMKSFFDFYVPQLT